jgi:hypothetical protein
MGVQAHVQGTAEAVLVLSRGPFCLIPRRIASGWTLFYGPLLPKGSERRSVEIAGGI